MVKHITKSLKATENNDDYVLKAHTLGITKGVSKMNLEMKQSQGSKWQQ